MKSAKREISITSDIIVGFPGETEETLAKLVPVRRSRYDAVFTFKYSPRPNTPSLALEDAIPDEEKVAASKCSTVSRDRFRPLVTRDT